MRRWELIECPVVNNIWTLPWAGSYFCHL
jgi:hypothetical protein